MRRSGSLLRSLCLLVLLGAASLLLLLHLQGAGQPVQPRSPGQSTHAHARTHARTRPRPACRQTRVLPSIRLQLFLRLLLVAQKRPGVCGRWRPDAAPLTPSLSVGLWIVPRWLAWWFLLFLLPPDDSSADTHGCVSSDSGHFPHQPALARFGPHQSGRRVRSLFNPLNCFFELSASTATGKLLRRPLWLRAPPDANAV